MMYYISRYAAILFCSLFLVPNSQASNQEIMDAIVRGGYIAPEKFDTPEYLKSKGAALAQHTEAITWLKTLDKNKLTDLANSYQLLSKRGKQISYYDGGSFNTAIATYEFILTKTVAVGNVGISNEYGYKNYGVPRGGLFKKLNEHIVFLVAAYINVKNTVLAPKAVVPEVVAPAPLKIMAEAAADLSRQGPQVAIFEDTKEKPLDRAGDNLEDAVIDLGNGWLKTFDREWGDVYIGPDDARYIYDKTTGYVKI